MLSPWHLEVHIRDITKKSQQAGYHGGLTLNSLAAFMCEPYQKVLDVLDDMVGMKTARPFGCAITMAPVWYIKGISQNYSSIDSLLDYGYSRSNTRLKAYTDVYKEARTLAENYPNMGFDELGQPSTLEIAAMRDRLGLPIVLRPMTDLDCLLCGMVNQVPQPVEAAHGPAAIDFIDNDDDDNDDVEFDDDTEAPF